MIIRTAVPADSVSLCNICRNDLGYECPESLVMERIAGLDGEREAVFVAEIDGLVAGFIQVELYRTLYFETMANILGLACDSNYRRRGLGKALVGKAEEWASDKGARFMRLNSGASREEAHIFYRNLGYGSEKGQLRFFKEL